MFRNYYKIFFILILFFDTVVIKSQTDTIPPVSPVLEMVSVNPQNGNVEILWSPSPSADVLGYIVYLLKNNAGFYIDTINDPMATSYTWTGSGSSFYSESFVIAAFDEGNRSPLSNHLTTIFCNADLDSCKREINLTWNSYIGHPKKVLGYTVLVSVDEGEFEEAGRTDTGITDFTLRDLLVNRQYCFIINASLEDGSVSRSNRICIDTKMQRTPDWINTNYVTVNDENHLEMSFSIDPASEIRLLNVERKTGNEGIYELITVLPPSPYPQEYIDTKADPEKINYYRSYIKNSCGIPVVYSNPGSNIVLSALLQEGDLILKWNPYRKWTGGIDSYKIFVNTGKGWEEEAEAGPNDSTCVFKDISGLMYRADGNEICFKIYASEAMNPFGISGESQSAEICIPVIEKITVPDLFTPDNNSLNDFFRPVLSFSPVEYSLIITDLKRKTVFETNDYNMEWDGTNGGVPLGQGLYLWFLKVRSPSGRTFSQSGTVTIVFNQ